MEDNYCNEEQGQDCQQQLLENCPKIKRQDIGYFKRNNFGEEQDR